MITYEPLRKHLDRKGLSMEALKRELGFTSNVATSLRNDMPNVKLELLADIARYLGVDLCDIIAISESETPEHRN